MVYFGLLLGTLQMPKGFCTGGWIQPEIISDVDCIQITDLQFILR